MFCDRNISGFTNVNRGIARVFGGGTLTFTPRLCEALPEAKREGDGVQIVNNHKYKNMKKVCLVLVAAVVFAAVGYGSGGRISGSSAVALTQSEFSVEEITDKYELQKDVIDAIKQSKQSKFADFELLDSLSVNIDDVGKIYLLLKKINDFAGVVVSVYKCKGSEVTLLDENENIIPFDTGIYFLYVDDNSTFSLRSEYGAGSGDVVYFSYNSDEEEGIFVDSLVLFRRVFGDDEIYIEKATITKEKFGNLRLKDLTEEINNEISSKYGYEFEKVE